MRPGGRDTTEHHDDSLLDPFVRFKQHIDSTFHSAYNTMRNYSPFSSPDGSGQSSSTAGWEGFEIATSPSYAPSELAHLPQPVPNDLPKGCDPSLLGFQAAFEDLLAVMNDRPLPDIRQVYEQNKLLKHMYPHGEPPWFCLQRLEASGLICEPPPPPLPRFPPRNDGPNWESMHQELQRKAEEVWGNNHRGDQHADPREVLQGAIMSAANMVEQLTKDYEKGSKARDQLMEKISKEIDDRQKAREEARSHDPQTRKGPEHFDELFNSLQNWAESGKNSWDTFMKTIVEGSGSLQRPKHSEASSPDTRLETDSNEYIDENGNRVFHTVKKVVDKEGNVLSTTQQIFSAPDTRSRSENRVPGEAKAEESADHEKGKREGWFWTK